MKKRTSAWLWKIAIIVLLLITTELLSRYFGFHQFPLFEESTQFEYIHKPYQDTRIYRNHFITNAYSMRSGPVANADTLVVLLIGDSVINGGNQTDHADLASTHLETALTKVFHRTVRVLNISSFTWGPDNAYAYLKKYGTFGADLFVLVHNSGDAYDNMTFEKVVGVHPNFIAKNYPLASIKLVEKGAGIIQGLVKKYSRKELPKPSGSQLFNSGFKNIDSLARSLNVPLIAFLHATKEEMQKKSYSADGRLILDFYKKQNRTVLKGLDQPMQEAHYLDDIHIDRQGQLFLSQILFEPIRSTLATRLSPIQPTLAATPRP